MKEELIKDIVNIQFLIFSKMKKTLSKEYFEECQGLHMVEDITYNKFIKKIKDKVKELDIKNERILDKIKSVEKGVSDLGIANIRYAAKEIDKLSNKEKDLMLIRFLELSKTLNNMCTLSETSEMLSIPLNTIKNACLGNRILNTQKRGRIWLVDVQECKRYWNIKS